MRVRWSKIRDGRKIEGGRMVDDVGMVFVSEEDEKEIALLGGDPWVDLVDRTAASSRVKQWVMQNFTPAS